VTLSLADAPVLLGTLVEVQRRTALVAGDDGNDYRCQYSPVIDLADFSNFAVGDRVDFIATSAQQESMITGIRPRTSKISRPGPMDRAAEELILAANVDALVVVASTRKPEFNPRLVDRYLALAEIFGIQAIICLNKTDLDPVLPRELEYLHTLGYPVVSISAKLGTGLDELCKAMEGKQVVLSGPSGVGKSSVIRALVPGALPKVADVRKGEGKGRHTTTSSHLYRVAGGIGIIDTPGIRELGFRGITRRELADHWRDFEPYVSQCRFRDCWHKSEPNCAVTKAVADGALPDFRYQSYLRIQESLEA
jgi:ribosome biogenesis GTPase